MGSKGIADKVAIVAMGLHPIRGTLGSIPGRHDHHRRRRSTRPGPARARRHRCLLAGYPRLSAVRTGLSRALGTDYKPVTRVENYCATGSESFRNACYAVACGATDRVMAVGVEKLRIRASPVCCAVIRPETGPRRNCRSPRPPRSHCSIRPTAPNTAWTPDRCRGDDPVAWKNHVSSARNPQRHSSVRGLKQKIDSAPKVAGRLGVFDCSGVSDGAACALIVRAGTPTSTPTGPSSSKRLRWRRSGAGIGRSGYDFTTFPEVVRSAQDAYAQAGITDPQQEISLAEVHDCFTPTELVLMEDLGFCDRGQAWKESLSGAFDADGRLPVNVDGGLKSFGHPVGASGLRMLYEAWLQLRGEAGPGNSTSHESH